MKGRISGSMEPRIRMDRWSTGLMDGSMDWRWLDDESLNLYAACRVLDHCLHQIISKVHQHELLLTVPSLLVVNLSDSVY